MADADVIQLPTVQSEGKSGSPTRSAGAPAREGTPKCKRTHAPPWVRLQLLFAGASVIDPMLKLWMEHTASAKAYEHRWARWPVLAWGVVHAWVMAPAVYFWLWATRSLPRAGVTAVVIATTLWWFHMTLMFTIILGGHVATLTI
jgi:hypothetical protein